MSLNTAVMFGRASDEWRTPLEFYMALHVEFGFDVDVAATAENTQMIRYFGPDHHNPLLRDALAFEWRPYAQTAWMNPPYSRVREFIAKAALEAAMGCTVVCLVPARTDTRWWHEHVWDRVHHRARPGVEVRFIKGRLKFGGATAGAPFPSVLIVFRKAHS